MLAYLLFAAAASGTAPALVPPVVVDRANKKDRVICKVEQFVGSRVSQRICLTETEWRIARDRAQEDLDDGRRIFPQPGKKSNGN